MRNWSQPDRHTLRHANVLTVVVVVVVVVVVCWLFNA